MPTTSRIDRQPKDKTRNSKNEIGFEVGSGNVFADLGLDDADILLAKSNLVIKINSLIESRGLTQVQAAKLLGVDQPKVSALRRGKLGEFSLERLMRFLRRLNHEVEIKVKPKPSESTLKVVPSRALARPKR